jgi:hypothetical protein
VVDVGPTSLDVVEPPAHVRPDQPRVDAPRRKVRRRPTVKPRTEEHRVVGADQVGTDRRQSVHDRSPFGSLDVAATTGDTSSGIVPYRPR